MNRYVSDLDWAGLDRVAQVIENYQEMKEKGHPINEDMVCFISKLNYKIYIPLKELFRGEPK